MAVDRSVLARFMIGLVALALAGTTILQWDSAVDRAAAEQDELVAFRLLELRTYLARTLIDEVNLLLAAPLGLVEPAELQAAEEQRREALQTGLVELQALSVGSGITVGQTAEMLQIFEDWGPSGQDPTLDQIFEGTLILRYEGVPLPAASPTQFDSLYEIQWIDETSSMTQFESTMAMLEVERPEVSEEITLFMEQRMSTVRSTGGYFVESGQRPLDNGWMEIDLVEAHEASTFEALNEIVADTNLGAMNQWLRRWTEPAASTPPVPFGTFFNQNQTTTAEMRTIVADRLDAVVQETQQQVRSANSQARWWLLVTGLLIAFALAALWLAASLIWLRSKTLRELATTDPLTGIGNRHLLGEQTASLLYNEGLRHHIIITIDLDHFKLTNDTYGHVVGDSVLVHLAGGLNHLAETAAVDAHTVVRLGGDEFLVSLHAAQPIDIDPVRRGLERLRSESLPINPQTAIPVQFSYGIAGADGSPPLSQLMDASDLAAYEEKSTRRSTAVDPPQVSQDDIWVEAGPRF